MINRILYPIKRKYNQLKRVIDFLPLIWRGYDFDYRYALDLFKYQLKRSADFLESDKAMTIESKNNASRIRTFIKLMDKIYDGDYSTGYQEELEKLYGEKVLDWHFIPTEENDGSSYLKYEYKFWGNQEEIQIKHDELFKKSQIKEKRAEELLWRYLHHNIRNWWD